MKLAPPTALRELWLHVDRLRLRQVLANLLSNAIKYNRRGGLVHARADRLGNEVAIAVTDTGIGLDPDQLAHLWEPFNRLGAERTTVEGTGIGLALSQRMVQMMDGRIEVQSQAGRGSCFTVYLPAAEAPLATDRRAASTPADARRGAQRTVLYAEDNPINVELVQQVFRLRPQLRLLVAESGAQALQLARASPARPAAAGHPPRRHERPGRPRTSSRARGSNRPRWRCLPMCIPRACARRSTRASSTIWRSRSMWPRSFVVWTGYWVDSSCSLSPACGRGLG